MPSAENHIAPESAAIAKSVRDLLLRKGIAKRSQSKKLKEILNLSLSQAHRKMNGSSNWELSQIKQVADFFGEPFESFHTMFSSPIATGDEDMVPAIFAIEGRKLRCLVRIGASLHTVRNVDYVASKADGDEWQVYEAASALESGKYYKVKKLELSLKQTRKLTVAVLDDDEGSADNLCEYLNETGFHAEAFYDIETLSQVVTEKPFDAYVIDWLIGGKTAEALIKLIRTDESIDAPIFLLTGEITTGRAHESEVARIIIDYNVSLYEKPTRLPIIAAKLSKALGIA
jgi:CheY-like chemotaxis protein